MLRLRVLRVVIPALLLLLVVFFIRELRPRPAVHGAPAAGAGDDRQRALGTRFTEWIGGKRSVAGDIEVTQQLEDGSLELEGIRSVEIAREGRGPLIVAAEMGEAEGDPGRRSWRFREKVVIQDRDEDLRLELPSLEIDEAVEKRSEGSIRFEGPNLSGRARGLLYSLKGLPGELVAPEFDEPAAGRLVADRARLVDGLRDIELLGNVQIVRNGEQLDAGRVRLIRDASDRLRRAELGEDVRGSWALSPGQAARVQAREGEVRWNELGVLASAVLTGEARLRRDTVSLEAERIEARLSAAPRTGWQIRAAESVFLRGVAWSEESQLRCADLEVLDADLALLTARASGGVVVDGQELRAESDTATFETGREAGEIELLGSGARKARLARQQTRVAADTILTDRTGERLAATGRVEASLLPAAESGAASGVPGRLFLAGDAVHFVAERLDLTDSGARMTFQGGVRGWQGDRNLAADRVAVVDQTGRTLRARKGVSTRVPRRSDGAARIGDDFLQITAAAMDYDEASGQAIYTESVRLNLAEGWLEASRLEVDLAPDGRGVAEVRAEGTVELEFRSGSGQDLRVIAGTADRVVYLPGEQVVRLFGVEAPASVRRLGPGGETTTGRVLRYRMDLGRLEVDSGEQGPATIRTSGS